jgi:hypothetical protein
MASLAFTKLLSLRLLELLSLLSLALTGHQLTLQLRTPPFCLIVRYITFGRTVEKTLLLALLVV